MASLMDERDKTPLTEFVNEYGHEIECLCGVRYWSKQELHCPVCKLMPQYGQIKNPKLL